MQPPLNQGLFETYILYIYIYIHTHFRSISHFYLTSMSKDCWRKPKPHSQCDKMTPFESAQLKGLLSDFLITTDTLWHPCLALEDTLPFTYWEMCWDTPWTSRQHLPSTLNDVSAHKTPESEENSLPLFLHQSGAPHPPPPSPLLLIHRTSRDVVFVIPPLRAKASAGRQLVYPRPLTTWQEELAWLACLLFCWLGSANEASALCWASRITPASQDKHKQDPLSLTISLRVPNTHAQHRRCTHEHTLDCCCLQVLMLHSYAWVQEVQMQFILLTLDHNTWYKVIFLWSESSLFFFISQVKQHCFALQEKMNNRKLALLT